MVVVVLCGRINGLGADVSDCRKPKEQAGLRMAYDGAETGFRSVHSHPHTLTTFWAKRRLDLTGDSAVRSGGENKIHAGIPARSR